MAKKYDIEFKKSITDRQLFDLIDDHYNEKLDKKTKYADEDIIQVLYNEINKHKPVKQFTVPAKKTTIYDTDYETDTDTDTEITYSAPVKEDNVRNELNKMLLRFNLKANRSMTNENLFRMISQHIETLPENVQQKENVILDKLWENLSYSKRAVQNTMSDRARALAAAARGGAGRA